MSGELTKIQRTVAELVKRNLFAVVVPTADPHNSEYVNQVYQRRAMLTGFKGSAGTCVVTRNSDALLWTDGRYWLEAAQTLDDGWKLMKQGDPECPTIEDWLLQATTTTTAASASAASTSNGEEKEQPCKKVGIDASTQLWTAWRRLASTGLDVVPTDGNIVDVALNHSAVPPVRTGSVVPLDAVRFAGKSTADKVAAVAAELQKQQADVTVLSMLCEVAWLLNLRDPACNDIPMAPTFFAFAVVSSTGRCFVFVDESKFSAEAKAALEAAKCVEIVPYSQLEEWMINNSSKTTAAAAPAGIFNNFGKTAVVSESSCSFHIYDLLERRCGFKVRGVKAGIVEKMKSVKNETELAGFRAAHVRDGVALTRFLSWLDQTLAPLAAASGDKKAEDSPITEHDAAQKLLHFRKTTNGDLFFSPSFETIPGAGGNGAIVHYRCDPAKAAKILPTDMFLCDSGGQYSDGTTDVTRTCVFTTPEATPKHWRTAYTLVLKGHIRLNTVVFPGAGRTTGHQLDALARLDLWKHGLNYAHGTGHGVGHFLNVHEGPFGVGMRHRESDQGLQTGNIVSNEPGFYVSGEFGIRIENLDEVVDAPTDGAALFGKGANALPCCRLKSITMAPLCRALIDKELLSAEEIAWVDEYHAKVKAALAPGLKKWEAEDGPQLMAFLDRECAPL